MSRTRGRHGGLVLESSEWRGGGGGREGREMDFGKSSGKGG